MSTYQTLRGLKVKYLASDPSPAKEGEVWYNTTTGLLKSFVGLSAWAAVSPIVVATSSIKGSGTQTAGLAFSGQIPAHTGVTYEGDGTNWTTGGTMNSARSSAVGSKNGTQTATLCISGNDGSDRAYVESYDGSTWTEIADINTARRGLGGAGTSTAALIAGGVSNSALS